MTPEGKVKHAVRKLLDARAIWYYMPVQTGYGVTGIPDFVCCWHGAFLDIECKAPGRRTSVTPLQQRCLEQIREHGGYAAVVTSAAELETMLDLARSMQCPT